MSKRAWSVLVSLIFLMMPVISVAQTADSDTSIASCTFADEKSITVHYQPAPRKKSELPAGRVWLPGGSALTLFAETDTTLGTTDIPAGGYTMYLVPGRKDWTLIVSKNTDVSKYNEGQDLARASMQVGELDQPAEFSVFFGHIAPKICEINVEYGKVRAWTEFKEK